MRPRDFLPWRRFVIETSWSPNAVILALEKQINAPRLFDFEGSLPFIGKATSATQLRFRRRIWYQNSFLPRIVVSIGPSARGGARLDVRMRLHVLVALFTTLWMTVATVGGVSIAVSALASGRVGGLLALAMPMFGAALTSIPFAIEARKAEGLLRETYATAPGLPLPVSTGAYR